MENYYSNDILNIRKKVILFRIETVYEEMNKDPANDIYLDVDDYIKAKLNVIKAVKTPQKFLINYHVSDISMLSNLDIEICDDANLTAAMMLKTTTNLYVPGAEIKFDQDKIVSYLIFDKDEYFANSR